jgi:hypothetical protein
MESPSEAELVSQGRHYVRLAAALLVLLSVAATALYLVRVGPDKLPQQGGRLLLTVGLGYALTRGKAWARWLTVLLVFLGLFTVAPAFAGADAFRPPRLGGTLVLLAMFVAYGVVGRLMLWSASVRTFFRASRPSRAEPAAPAV